MTFNVRVGTAALGMLAFSLAGGAGAEESPGSPEAGLRRAAELRVGKKYDEAIAVLQDLAEKNGTNPEVHSEAQYQKGLIQEEAGRGAEALASYEASFSGTPGTLSAPFALLGWARVKARAGEVGDAVATYDQVLLNYPRYGAIALLRRGEIEERQGERLAALSTYRALERNYPRDPEVESAKASAGRICEDLAGSSVSTTVLSEVLAQGDCLLAADRFDEAEVVYRSALKRSGSAPERAEFLMALGRCYEARGEYGTAKRTYRRAAREMPSSSHAVAAQMAIVQIHLDQGRYGDAVRELRRVVKKHPGTDQAAEAQCMVGACYESLGEMKKAEESYRKVRDIAPRSPWAFEAQRQMVRLMEMRR